MGDAGIRRERGKIDQLPDPARAESDEFLERA
jgi:hypothetical protein